jgi:hypothetical protein
MSIIDKNTQITELDFQKIKTNFREFLKNQDEFTDFNLESSGMDVILDILAYDTFYNAFYLNTAVNETFLSTATQRKNIVKRAQALNYLPKSFVGATNTVNVEIEIPDAEELDTGGIVQLERDNRFQTIIDNETYTFVNVNPVTLTQLSPTRFFARNVLLKQGVPNTFSYVVDTSDSFQRFIIPEERVDISSLNVISQSPELAETTQYVFHKDIQIDQIDSDTRIFFVFENSEGEYEIIFGDGRFGYKPIDGEVISLQYLVTDGPSANGSRVFTGSNRVTISGNIIENVSVTVTTETRSFGGAVKESDRSIAFNAPRLFQAQDRAVISNDFAGIIRSQFSNVESVNVWGGELNIPPQYGRVFIAVKPFGSDFFREIEKENINNFILEKMVGSVRPVIVDPRYTYIRVNHNIKFDSKSTLRTQSEIRNIVIDNTIEFSQENIETFRKTFFLSQLTSILKNVDDSIQSIESSIQLVKRFVPQLNVPTSYTLYYQNPIKYLHPGFRASITSSTFRFRDTDDCRFQQNQSGNLSIVATVAGVERTLVSDAGDVDYQNGVILLKAFSPQSFSGRFFRLFVVPDSQDVSSEREFILKIEESDVIVNVVDTTSIASLTGSLSSRIDSSTTTVDVSSTSF